MSLPCGTRHIQVISLKPENGIPPKVNYIYQVQNRECNSHKKHHFDSHEITHSAETSGIKFKASWEDMNQANDHIHKNTNFVSLVFLKSDFELI